MTAPLVPVTVVGGYLGAGKTTMIAELLRSAQGRRLAVLVNDFGALNLDAALLGTAATETETPDIVELTNGCICCSMADALGDGLDAVLSLDPAPDQIVIETSGVADPAKVAAYGQGWPGTRLDAVVTVVAADAVRAQADDPFVGTTITRQLVAADLLALSRLDLLEAIDSARPPSDSGAERPGGGAEPPPELASWLASMTSAPLLSLRHGRIEPSVVLDVAADISERRWAVPESDEPDESAHGFQAVALTRTRPVDPDRLAFLLAEWPDNVVRVKGLVRGADGRSLLAQRVGRRWTIEPAAQLVEQTRIVAITVGHPASTSTSTSTGSPVPAPTSSADLDDQLGP